MSYKIESAAPAATVNGGVPLGLLGVAFVVLKLCGVIGWPWLWVTCPFWAPLAIAGAALVIFFIVIGLGVAAIGIKRLFSK